MTGMKSIARIALVTILFSPALIYAASAQGPARGRIEAPRDPILEIASKHNLEVARWSISKRKAYSGAVDRLQEIIDTHPEFSRMDEVLFWMAEAHIKLDKAEKAESYLETLVEKYPGSEFVKRAQERLEKLKEDKRAKG